MDISTLKPGDVFYTARLSEPEEWISPNIKRLARGYGVAATPEAARALVPQHLAVSHIEERVILESQDGEGVHHRLVRKLPKNQKRRRST